MGCAGVDFCCGADQGYQRARVGEAGIDNIICIQHTAANAQHTACPRRNSNVSLIHGFKQCGGTTGDIFSGIATITDSIAVDITLCEIGNARAIIDSVKNAIIVDITIAYVTGPIAIGIELVGVSDAWAIVGNIGN